MVQLISQQNRIEIGIDTFERAIVWAAFTLRAANTSLDNPIPKKENPYYNAIRINKQDTSQGETAATAINVSAKFPYDWEPFLSGMGDIFENVKEIADYDYEITTIPVTPSTGLFVPIEVEPPQITTLEQYFVWATVRLSKYLYPSFINVKYRFLEEDPVEPSLAIDVTLPYDFIKYSDTRNYLESVIAIALPLVTTDPNFSNSSQVSNVSIVGN
ncbi:MAG: hypothetical protein HC820_01780 [Hydrococcus sp. RM1_1_31]|nr:hypothetical protein [Hydrococcus sp. RM1_1_31]